MCGIAGWIKFNEAPVDAGAFYRAMAAISHRGPNDEGILFLAPGALKFEERGGVKTPKDLKLKDLTVPLDWNASAVFGHQRLSIIDLSLTGHQPMCNEDRTIWVAYNGEVYNYRELKLELENSGHIFKSSSDTEVLIHGYEAWGISALLEKIVGMWAFVLCDARQKKVFLVRDRFGIKPLYVHVSKEEIIFGSEMRVIKSLYPAMLNENKIAQYLWFKPFTARDTFYAGIEQIPSATYLEIDLQNQATTETRYWTLEKVNSSYAKVDWKAEGEKFLSILEESIFFHLRSDVPIGISLSGGLDSSTITCLINQFVAEKKIHEKSITSMPEVKSYTSVPEDLSLSEMEYVTAVKELSGIQNFTVTPKFEEFARDLETLIDINEEPLRDPSVYMQFRVMQLAREHNALVLLEGQGADETLAGYNTYIYTYFKDLLKHKKYFAITRELFRFADIWKTFFRKFLRRSVGLTRSAFDKVIKVKEPTTFKEDYPVGNLAERLRADTLSGYLLDLLKTGDRNSMHFSIESRVPFLYHPLVEYVFQLPSTCKIHSGWTKSIMRRAMKGILPEKVRQRRKKFGFPSPERQWALRMIRDQKDQVQSLLKFAEDFVDLEEFSKLCEAVVQKSRPEDVQLFWRIIFLAQWLGINQR